VTTVVLLVTNSGSGAETPTAGSTTVPAAPNGEASARRELFGNDDELLRLAVPAVDRAENCSDAKNTQTDRFGSRTQVRCKMTTSANEDLIIEFMSSDAKTSCDLVSDQLHVNVQKSGTWKGNGRSGRWKDITFTPVDAPGQTFPGVYYETDAGTACAVLNPAAESTSVTGNAIHDFWVKTAQPS
jgi:hypothetical protein